VKQKRINKAMPIQGKRNYLSSLFSNQPYLYSVSNYFTKWFLQQHKPEDPEKRLLK